MPVRKIGKSHTVVTGLVAAGKSKRMIAYEGDLERDFIKLMLFDSKRVLEIEEQPVKIYFTDAEGKVRSYTPDVLVTFRDGTPPLLGEVKPRRILKEKWKELKPRFRAARLYAKERGWKFKLFDEVRIRTPYLDNVVFLLGFRRLEEDAEKTTLILQTLHELRESTPEALLNTITKDKMTKAYLTPFLWKLVANFEIDANLEEPLTMVSPIRSLLSWRCIQ